MEETALTFGDISLNDFIIRSMPLSWQTIYLRWRMASNFKIYSQMLQVCYVSIENVESINLYLSTFMIMVTFLNFKNISPNKLFMRIM